MFFQWIILVVMLQGTATDFDGNFSISVDQGDVLVFSYVGYSTQEIAYNGQLSFNISMSLYFCNVAWRKDN